MSDFNSLPEEAKQRIREKAQWEHMTLSAVMEEWPELKE